MSEFYSINFWSHTQWSRSCSKISSWFMNPMNNNNITHHAPLKRNYLFFKWTFCISNITHKLLPYLNPSITAADALSCLPFWHFLFCKSRGEKHAVASIASSNHRKCFLYLNQQLLLFDWAPQFLPLKCVHVRERRRSWSEARGECERFIAE